MESLFLLNFSDGRQWQGSDKGWAALSAAWQAVAGGGICTGLPRTYHHMGAVTNSGRKWRKGSGRQFRGGANSGRQLQGEGWQAVGQCGRQWQGGWQTVALGGRGGWQAVTWDGEHAVAEGGRQVAGEGPQCISQWHSVAVVAGERVAGAVSGGGGRQFEGGGQSHRQLQRMAGSGRRGEAVSVGGGAVAGMARGGSGRQLQGEGWQGVRVN